jgi:uncharacterized protein YbcC (UPF0753/DUF2309 family)
MDNSHLAELARVTIRFFTRRFFEMSNTASQVLEQKRLRHPSIEKPLMNLHELESLMEAISETLRAIAPLWPLRDYVAVNPFVGLSELRFLEARGLLRQVRSGDILLPLSYYRNAYLDGTITTADLEDALVICQSQYPDQYGHRALEAFLARLGNEAKYSMKERGERKYWTVSEAIDRDNRLGWTGMIVNEISRHCAAHFDEGQAVWDSPWKEMSLYDAWRNTALLDRRFERLGVAGFRRFVSTLPINPCDAIAYLLERLQVPSKHWQMFLLSELLSIPGWSSYVKYRVRESEMAGGVNADLIGLLAIRLAYDVGLQEARLIPNADRLWPASSSFESQARFTLRGISDDVAARYLFQVAAETSYQRRLCNSIQRNACDTTSPKTPASIQMVFCIDVRSEVVRRHLESVSSQIETYGFAGFFGLPMEYVSMGESNGSSQCPVLLTPHFAVHEKLRLSDESQQSTAIVARQRVRSRRKIWKFFQSSATSCFTFVESLGLVYAVELVRSTLGINRPQDGGKFDGVSKRDCEHLGPVLHSATSESLSVDRQVELALGILRNLGLTTEFARLVVICGHASQTVNNPYAAGLDCGACGGHSGESNARFASMLLNDPEVRAGLRVQGVSIPCDTIFIPAVHNTTTDAIRFFDVADCPDTHADLRKELVQWVAEASVLARIERSSRLGNVSSAELLHRSRDWSEVRPEWGLAGNAALIVAPRSRTKGLVLDGRTFMHSYEFHQDTDLKVLELVMTAPMVVANWINLQYYASTVDNQAYGSGNKALHNMVGQIGILQGNGGDLMTGLPWQSVHDGKAYQHEPLRLTVVIEAPRAAIESIIEKHSVVKELAGNGWLSLMALEEDRFYLYSSDVGWSRRERLSPG